MSLRCVGNVKRSVIVKANEFVKKFGWGEVIKFVGWYGGDTSFKFLKVKEQTISVHSGDQPYDFHIDDLKRLVESHELVESCGGLESAKKELQRQSIFRWINPETERLREAIADVESCQ